MGPIPVNIIIKIAASAVMGAVAYATGVIIFDFFTPVIGVSAGFFSVAVFLTLTNIKKNEQIMPLYVLLIVAVVAVLSLLVGYLFLYFFKPEIIHNTTCYAKDFISFPEFIVSTFQIPDISCTIFGAIAAYALINIKTG